MAAGDVGALVDLASSTATSSDSATESSIESTEVNTEAAGNSGTESQSSGQTSAADASGEGKGDGERKPDAVDSTKALTPHAIRNTIKTLKASQDSQTPEGQATIKALNQIHQSVERSAAYAQVFPKVEQAREAKQFLDSVGGIEQASTILQSMNDSDALLHAGDPKLIDNIIEDLKSEGKLEAFGQLAPAFLDKLRTVDNAAYYKAFAPHFVAALRECDVPAALNNLHRALAGNNVAAAKEVLNGMTSWFNGLYGRIEQFNRVDPERERFKAEKSAWESSKVKERNVAIATEAESYNNRELGKQLANYLRMPFFKGFPRETLTVIGNQLKSDLFNDLKADKVYQTQMKALWGAKNPDKSKITEYHKAAVQSRAERIVRDVIQRMYPGYARGGAAAGRIAAATQKRDAQQQSAATATAQGNPVYVINKPKWNDIDWSKDPRQLHFIAGKAWLKSGRFVTWRRTN